ncbi:MAG: extracellular solute-binding protein, partial [Planctomycetota bacterium]
EVGKNYHPTFPDPVPFDPSEWETNTPPPSVAVPTAKKGGTLRLDMIRWPATLRTDGPNSRSSVVSTFHYLVYESLLGFDPTLMEYVPNLASHWKVSADKRTFTFRIDPRARWSDGTDVTADDVLATIEHTMNPDRKDPGVSRRYRDMIESVKILDRLTVEIRCKEARWRSFLSIGAGLLVFPAAYIRMDGETYIDDWNWRLPPGTGPYLLDPNDIKPGRSITLRRRKDWWAKDKPDNQGLCNFDRLTWTVIRDPELVYTKFLAGELDVYRVTRAQRWVQELDDVKPIRQGWIQKRKVFNKEPQGYGGYALNMRRPPFDDLKVRKAFSHLMNREKLFGSFFYYQYEYVDSYFPGMEFARENAERTRYDPKRARELLAAAGWVKKNEEGYLVDKDGKRFPEIKFEYALPSFQRIYDVFRNDLWNEAGIKMKMKLIDSIALSKKMWEYKFDLCWINWTASNFPSLDLSWHSRNADELQTNNLPGFKNEEVDAIIAKYKLEFDAKKRKKMLQRVDEILFEAHPYVLSWYGPYFRVLYWDRFGHPPEYSSRFTAGLRNVIYYWWYDEEKATRLEDNRRRGAPNYPQAKNGQYDDVEQKHWLFEKLPMEDE